MKLKKVILIIIISAGTMTIITGLLPFKKTPPEFKQATESNLPNILQITMDGQQWQTIANRSTCNTPNINRLAAEGILFNRSYTTNPLCCPARASLLTGAYGWHNGVLNQVHSVPSVSRDMRENTVTYSMLAKKAGYNTGYVGKWHASYKRLPTAFGYDEFGAPHAINPELLKEAEYSDESNINTTIIESRTIEWPGSKKYHLWHIMEGEDEDTNSWGIAETGIKMMERLSGKADPWLMEFHFYRPVSYQPLKKYADRYEPSEIPVPESFYDSYSNKPNIYKRDRETYNEATEQDCRNGRAAYYAHIEQIDVQIGRIIDALEESGQAENTIVVCTTDHGQMIGDHGLWHMGICPAEETYKIPLVIRWPGRITPGSVCDHLVLSQDLAHTYVDIFGEGPLPYADATSLLPLFKKPHREDWRDQIMCTFYGGEFLYTQRIAISDQYKYVFNGFDYDECYDLVNDPVELVNLINDPQKADIVNDMRARLWEMMNKFEDPYGDTQNSADPGKMTTNYNAARYLPRGKRLGP